MLHTSLDEVDKHQIVESIVILNVRHSKAEDSVRSIQIQDPDKRVSDPTDLAIKPDGNIFKIMKGIVIKCWCAGI